MTSGDPRPGNRGDQPDAITPAERAALHALLDDLARLDRRSFDQLLAECPDLADLHQLDADLWDQVREALVDSADADPAFARLADQARRQAAGAPLTEHDAPGVFTDVTRELTPEDAQKLYRKVTPQVVFEVMRSLGQSANVAVAQRITDALCSDQAMARLRARDHVRDGIIEELCRHLDDAPTPIALDRERLLEIMEQCGAMGEVNTMANCIHMTKFKAG